MNLADEPKNLRLIAGDNDRAKEIGASAMMSGVQVLRRAVYIGLGLLERRPSLLVQDEPVILAGELVGLQQLVDDPDRVALLVAALEALQEEEE